MAGWPAISGDEAFSDPMNRVSMYDTALRQRGSIARAAIF